MKKAASGFTRSKTSHMPQDSENTDLVQRQSLGTEAFGWIKRQKKKLLFVVWTRLELKQWSSGYPMCSPGHGLRDG